MSSNKSDTNNVNVFEKIALTVLSLVIVYGIQSYTANTQANSLQYARIEERLVSQSAILLKMQKDDDEAAEWRRNMIERVVALEKMQLLIEQDIERLDK